MLWAQAAIAVLPLVCDGCKLVRVLLNFVIFFGLLSPAAARELSESVDITVALGVAVTYLVIMQTPS